MFPGSLLELHLALNVGQIHLVVEREPVYDNEDGASQAQGERFQERFCGFGIGATNLFGPC